MMADGCRACRVARNPSRVGDKPQMTDLSMSPDDVLPRRKCYGQQTERQRRATDHLVMLHCAFAATTRVTSWTADELRDGELEPTVLSGDRCVRTVIDGACRGRRMIEHAGHRNDLTDWQHGGVLTGRI
jgi:hypothetical protein